MFNATINVDINDYIDDNDIKSIVEDEVRQSSDTFYNNLRRQLNN